MDDVAGSSLYWMKTMAVHFPEPVKVAVRVLGKVGLTARG